MKTNLTLFTLFLIAILMGSCNQQEQAKDTPKADETAPSTEKTLTMEISTFGTTPDGKTVTLFEMSNGQGMKVGIINYGANIVSLQVPDKNGEVEEVTLGYDSFEAYVENPRSFGAVIGRYANRIAKGKFTLEGQTYELATNNGNNHIHGGIENFKKKYWEPTEVERNGEIGVQLDYISKDMEEGYPGDLQVRVTYTLNEQNELRIRYEAKSSAPTHVNLTNHSYFNLNGKGKGLVFDHVLMINAGEYTPLDEEQIPTGAIESVEGTPLDFRTPTLIGDRIGEFATGYDHNFVLQKNGNPKTPTLAAKVYEPESGRLMEVLTTQPGMQFYTAHFIKGTVGRGGYEHQSYEAFCLETQHFPNTPNQENFPSTLVNPTLPYEETTIFKFSAVDAIDEAFAGIRR